MSDTYVVHLTRWYWLRLFPSAWLYAVRAHGVSPFHPYALALFVRGVFVLLFTRGTR